MSERRLPRNVRRLFRLPWPTIERIRREVDEELRFHIEMRAAELEARGLDPDAALAEAWRQFGDARDVRRHAIAVSTTVMRVERTAGVIGGMMQDLRFALRQARRAPLFTATAVATLALGIGANTAIFSVVHSLLIAPLPFPAGNRLVWLTRFGAEGHVLISPERPLIDAWRARAHSFEAIAAANTGEYELRDGARLDTVKAGAMTPNMLAVLGVRPALGRDLTAADAHLGAPPVAMIGYGEWQTRFGGANAIGRTIVVNGTPRTIVGVLPARLIVPFIGNDQARDLWIPLPDTGSSQLTAIGRLRRGASIEAANHELTAIAADEPDHAAWRDVTARASRAQDLLGDGFRRGVVLLFAAVGLVLLIACANVANLMLVRAWSRQREFAIRAALGAGRARLVRQLVAESLMVASGGGALGLVLAWVAIHIFLRIRPPGLADLDQVAIEPAVLAWTMAVTLGTGLLFGIAPAIFTNARQLTERLKSATRSATTTRGARVFRSVLIVGEIALSVMLLVSAGLLVRSFRALEQVDPGFKPNGLAALTVRLGAAGGLRGSGDAANEQRRMVMAALLQRMRATPGINEAVLASDLPPETGVSAGGFDLVDRPAVGTPRINATAFLAVQPGFFHAAGIRLRGRTFSGDTTGLVGGPSDEMIVNERLARLLWPDRDAIGQRVRFGKTIVRAVGVAGNLVVPGHSGDRYDLQLYVPISTLFAMSTVVFRTALTPTALGPTLEHVVTATSPRLKVLGVRSSEDELRVILAAPKFSMALLGVFALAALVLSAVGLYGVVAYAVSQRTREIGVRVALGAQPRDVARIVLQHGATVVFSGVLVGLAATFVSGRILRGFLYGTSPADPVTYVGVIVLLGGVALLASYLPARRAMRVDPVVALRTE